MTDAVREKLIEYVRARMPHPERLAMLAEEAAELGHAALKLRRALDGTNPTPISVEDAQRKLVEEMADVLQTLGMRTLAIARLTVEGLENMPWALREIQDPKLRRWADRLREKEEQSSEDPEDA